MNYVPKITKFGTAKRPNIKQFICPRGSEGGGSIRENKGGVENSGEGKTYHKTPSQKRFWTPPPPKNGLDPPTYDTFSPPVCFRPAVFLRGNGHRPGKSHFLRPPKLVLEGALYGTFSPQKIARYVLPPHYPLSKSNLANSPEIIYVYGSFSLATYAWMSGGQKFLPTAWAAEKRTFQRGRLVTLYRALPRDILSDALISRAMELWVSQDEETGCDSHPLACAREV